MNNGERDVNKASNNNEGIMDSVTNTVSEGWEAAKEGASNAYNGAAETINNMTGNNTSGEAEKDAKNAKLDV